MFLDFAGQGKKKLSVQPSAFLLQELSMDVALLKIIQLLSVSIQVSFSLFTVLFKFVSMNC